MVRLLCILLLLFAGLTSNVGLAGADDSQVQTVTSAHAIGVSELRQEDRIATYCSVFVSILSKDVTGHGERSNCPSDEYSGCEPSSGHSCGPHLSLSNDSGARLLHQARLNLIPVTTEVLGGKSRTALFRPPISRS